MNTMNTMTQTELEEALKLHALWLEGKASGKRLELYSYELEDLDFSYRRLSHSVFVGCKLKGCTFRGANLEDADFRASYIENCCFSLTNMLKTDFRGSLIRTSNFTQSKLDDTNFRGSYLRYVTFKNAKPKSDFFKPDFRGASCMQVVFSRGAKIRRAGMIADIVTFV